MAGFGRRVWVYAFEADRHPSLLAAVVLSASSYNISRRVIEEADVCGTLARAADLLPAEPTLRAFAERALVTLHLWSPTGDSPRLVQWAR